MHNDSLFNAFARSYEARSETKTLTDLSLTNISWFDTFNLPGNGYDVTDEKNQPIAGLDFKKVRAIVQSADVGGSYDEALKRLATEKSRNDYARVLDAGMRVQLLEAQMRQLVDDDGAQGVAVPQCARRPSAAERRNEQHRTEAGGGLDDCQRHREKR